VHRTTVARVRLYIVSTIYPYHNVDSAQITSGPLSLSPIVGEGLGSIHV
jgi:hypothetical protein